MKYHPATAVACGLLWALAQYCSEAYGAQPNIVTDPARQAHFVKAYIGTKMCMRSAGRAAHARGNDATHAQQYMLEVCGVSLFVVLRDDEMEVREAVATLRSIARTSYYEDVLSIPEPKSPTTRN